MFVEVIILKMNDIEGCKANENQVSGHAIACADGAVEAGIAGSAHTRLRASRTMIQGSLHTYLWHTDVYNII